MVYDLIAVGNLCGLGVDEIRKKNHQIQYKM